MQLLCGQCGNTLDVDEAKVGTTVDCWHCGRVVPAPRPGEVDFEASLPAEVLGLLEEVGFAALVREAMKQKIRVGCGSCGRTLTVSFRMAGKKARCPACGERLRVPFPDEGEEIEVRPAEPAEQGAVAEAPVAEVPAAEIVVDKGQALQDLAAAAAETETLPFEALARAAAESEQASFDGLTSAEREEEKDRLDLFATMAAPARGAGQVALSLRARRAGLQPEEKRMSTRAWLAVAAIVLLAVGTGVWVGRMLWPGGGPVEPEPWTEPGVVQKPGPDTPPTPPRPKPPRPKPPKPKPPQLPTCTLVAAWEDPFAAGGYAPARPGRVFRKISTVVKAGSKPASFRADKDVTLVAAGENFVSLGCPPEEFALAVRPRGRTVELKPGRQERVTFVFNLPMILDGSERGTLEIAGLCRVEAPPIGERHPAPPPERLTTYVETRPRNLRPLLSHPVMAAIQGARDQRLVVGRNSEDLSITIPEADVAGTASKAGRGHYQVRLKHGSESLRCVLRFFDRGNRLVLYLASEPFHEITYVQRGWDGRQDRFIFPPPQKDRAKPAPGPSRHDRPPDMPKPKPKKKYMPDIDPNEKSIFDF